MSKRRSHTSSLKASYNKGLGSVHSEPYCIKQSEWDRIFGKKIKKDGKNGKQTV